MAPSPTHSHNTPHSLPAKPATDLSILATQGRTNQVTVTGFTSTLSTMFRAEIVYLTELYRPHIDDTSYESKVHLKGTIKYFFDNFGYGYLDIDAMFKQIRASCHLVLRNTCVLRGAKFKGWLRTSVVENLWVAHYGVDHVFAPEVEESDDGDGDEDEDMDELLRSGRMMVEEGWDYRGTGAEEGEVVDEAPIRRVKEEPFIKEEPVE